MNRFFVYRPVFAWVIALFMLLFGTIALQLLPVEQYPDVAPPSLNIHAVYSGADARTIDQAVTSVIQDELNGLENFLYMSATSRANGTAVITVTFKPGTDLDIASMQVQDRMSRVEPRLPQPVRQVGVRVFKAASGFLMTIALQSKDGTNNVTDIGNFASNNIVNELRRVTGVGDVLLFGSSHAMRIWLDRDKLAGFGLAAAEVLSAVQEQNSQTATGALGAQPIAPGSEFNAQIVTQGSFSTAAEFREIIVRSNPDGSTVRLGDVARVEIGRDSYGFGFSVNGQESVGLSIQLTSGANALAVARGLRQRMAELEPSFPKGVVWSVPFDTTPFITTSVNSVVRSMVEALLLVTIVVFLFLQSWRATLIPSLVVPVALIGTCVGLHLFGISLNLLSLFGMVVAIGILNDDAIVVVENVERVMREEGLNARQATVKAVGQISGAVIASTLVLVAVFVPMAFFPGSTGGIYRQFSVTLTVSILLSTVLALTLGATLCAALLKDEATRAREAAENKPGLLMRGLNRVFAGFNAGLDAGTEKYIRGVGGMLAKPKRWLLVFLVACVATGWLFSRLPGGFLPTEDQGYVFVSYSAAPGSTTARTQEAIDQAEAFLKQQPQVRNVATVTGFSFFGQGQSAALTFVDLHPWDQRTGTENSASALVQRGNAYFRNIPGAIIFAMDPPAIPSMGTATGFTMMLQDRTGSGGAALEQASQQMLAAAAASPILAGVRNNGLPPAPQLYVEIDRVKARALGLQMAQVNRALSLSFGSNYVNDFVFEGSVLRVLIQGDASQRMRPEDVLSLRLRNNQNESVPFSAFTRVRWISGPQQLERYNGFPSATITGQAAPGHASGEALAEMDRIARQVLTSGLTYEWTGTAFEELQAGGQIPLLLGLSLVVVFLLLAALYESWAIPVSVLLILPFGVAGAVVLTMARGMSADVYFNIGLITIIGLATKNAILIVEFAIKEEEEGKDAITAVMNGARQRLRPILMTSVTFVLGMMPLVLATGAGAASRQAVGTGIMGSMLAATLFGIFFTPLFYVVVRQWLSRKKQYSEEADMLALQQSDKAAVNGGSDAV